MIDMIYVDLESKNLYLLDGDNILKTYPVAIGKETTPTPVGIFFINLICHDPQNYYKDTDGDGLQCLGAKTIDLNVYGWDKKHKVGRPYSIHGTNQPDLIGTKCSMGCIRMKNDDVVDLVDYVYEGMTVVIWFNSFSDYVTPKGSEGIIDYRLFNKGE